MALITLGINHKNAPLALREQLAFAETSLPQTLAELKSLPAVNEAVLLSTCNRTEIYTDLAALPAIAAWFRGKSQVLEPYIYRDIDAVTHLMRVASGLDSMVIGEAQILGQIKRAYQLAASADTLGPELKHLFPAVFKVSKQIRHQTALGASSLSLAYTAVQLAKRLFSNLARCKVLLIGAGETIQLAATHLQSCGVREFIIANRTKERAKQLLDVLPQAKMIRLSDIPVYLKDIDVVISATASQLPILGKGLFEMTLKARKRRPMFIADLAVPRDVEAQVSQLSDIYLYNIDDLQAVISNNLKDRQLRAEQAQAMITLEAQHYMQQMRVLSSTNLICDFRARHENLCANELQKAMLKLNNGVEPQKVLEQFSAALINKVMHQPTSKLREAAYHDKIEMLVLAKELFEL